MEKIKTRTKAKTKTKTNVVTIHEAKSNLSKLVKRAMAGETIYIGAYGKPEAELAAFSPDKQLAERRKGAFGCMKGKMVLHEGWEDPLPDEIIDLFYNSTCLEEYENK